MGWKPAHRGYRRPPLAIRPGRPRLAGFAARGAAGRNTAEARARRGATALVQTIVLELLLAVSGYQCYSAVRGMVVGRRAVAVAHGFAVLQLEHTVRLDLERPLQGLALHALWLVRLLNYYYVFMYLPFIAATAIALFVRAPAFYTRARRAFFLSGAIGLVIFALFPVAPPRLLPGAGFVDTVDRYYHEAGYAANPLANQFAAIPSFHFGWCLLAACCWWRIVKRRWLRALIALVPAVMLLSIIVTANHLWFDAAAGALVVYVAYRLAARLDPAFQWLWQQAFGTPGAYGRPLPGRSDGWVTVEALAPSRDR